MRLSASGSSCVLSARFLTLAALLLGASALPVAAQERPSDGMNIRRVDIRGLTSISEGFVRGVVKTRVASSFQNRQLQEDLRELLRSRKFVNVSADALVESGEAVVIFYVEEKPEIRSVEIDGAKQFPPEELYQELAFTGGSVLDRYDVDRGRENIERRYKEAGYYYVEVTLDETALELENRVLYHVVEGPRVKVREILFEGVRSFSEVQLRTKVRTQTVFWIFRRGAFDEQTTDRDAIDLQEFYRAEGFLDARVGYRLVFDSVDRTNLNILFVVEEGPRYTIRDIRLRGAEAFSDETLLAAMSLNPGDVIREDALQADVKRIEDTYGEIGYVAARALTSYDFDEEIPGVVTLNVDIVENMRSRFGRITIRGNDRTKDEVVRRELRFYPGEDYNTLKAREAEKRIQETGLFNRATVTPLVDVEGFREALVEVEEAQTVSFIIGMGVSTDNGVSGQLTIDNRNFDLFDWPRTWSEFFRGQSFRGAGQRLRFSAEPGTEVSRFRIDFTEPYLMNRPVRLDTSFYLFERARQSYDEQRLGTVWSLGRRFESGVLANWAIEGALRIEEVKISDLRFLASNDILDAKGTSFLTSLKGTIARDTTDSRLVPTEGYRIAFSWEQVGALGGDENFGKPTLSAAWHKTLRTDIFDRKSVLSVRGDVGYIVGDAPVYERFYGGGFGSIRGFEYQGVSPRQGIFEDRVGGDFIVLTGAEYSVPLYADTVRGVTFLDMGTVERDFGINSWRVSAGFGLRIIIPFFGPAPMVFDFGFPLASDDHDDERVFNFSFGASF